MKLYEKKRNPKFESHVTLNDCTDDGDSHRMEPLGSSAQACVYCTETRPVRAEERRW